MEERSMRARLRFLLALALTAAMAWSGAVEQWMPPPFFWHSL